VPKVPKDVKVFKKVVISCHESLKRESDEKVSKEL
jgi:hypothetical protein